MKFKGEKVMSEEMNDQMQVRRQKLQELIDLESTHLENVLSAQLLLVN